ncbi:MULTISPECIES: CHASE domain-containing protein [unclassified Lentimonas]|nr:MULTISPECIES: CHASE domain-containing protein [unclassified Lentimonas]
MTPKPPARSPPMQTSDTYNESLARWIKAHPLISNVALVILYFCFAQFGYLFSAIDHTMSPLWPPFGLVIATALLGNRKLLPGIFIGAWITQFVAGNLISTALAIATGVTLSSLIAHHLYLALSKFDQPLERIKVPLWIVLACLIPPLISSSIGVFSLFHLELAPPDATFATVWSTWWMGDTLGALVVAPVLITLHTIRPTRIWLFRTVILITLGSFSYFIIFLTNSDSTLIFLAFPILLLASHWFGPSGSAWATLAFVASAILTRLVFYMPIATDQFHEEVLLFDFFVFALSVTSLTLSAFYQKEHFLFPLILFLGGWTFCGWLQFTLTQNAQKIEDARFKDITDETERLVQDRFNTYVHQLKASAAFFINSSKVEQAEWRAYVDYINLNQHDSGINSIGFALRFTDAELSNYVTQMRAEEQIDLTIRTLDITNDPQDNEQYFIITHIESIENAPGSIGLDLASEGKLKAAAMRAMRTGLPTVSERLQIGNAESSSPGFFLFVPIYKANLPNQTTTQRQRALVGWSFATFTAEDFLNEIIRQRPQSVSMDVYDHGTLDETTLVYQSDTKSNTHSRANHKHTTQLNLGGKIFSFGWNRGSNYKTQETYSPLIATGSLALGTCLLVGIVVSLRSTNRRVNTMVTHKTKELLQANADLQKEVQERQRAEVLAEEAKRTAEAANTAKSEFLATMSHEIRTPMNSVIGFSELLASSELDDEQLSWANNINHSGENLLHIINDILDISKIEAGKLQLESIPFSLKQLATEAVDSFKLTADEQGVSIRSAFDKNLPEQLIGDPTRIKQIITNLISNALKFTSDGGVTLDISWQGDSNSGEATIRVSDTGIGIPAEKLDHLFEKFTQADSSTTREFGGTGLGLAICQQLTEHMHGRIHAESTLGVGTSMHVSLPFLSEARPEPKAAQRPAATTDTTTQQTLEVLLVDDNAINQKLGNTILSRLDCNVTLADDGQQAIQSIKQHTPDIIFMDCQMPVMDGYQAAAEIRKLEHAGDIQKPTHTHAIVIIALTANAGAEDKERCLKAGMNDYLRKPVLLKDFEVLLQNYRHI